MLTTCASHDPSRLIPITDGSNESERYAVRCGREVAGRFVKHVCDAVLKVLAVTSPSLSDDDLLFGDYQAAVPVDAEEVADVVMFRVRDSAVCVVGMVKSFWTLKLEEYPASRGVYNLISMQPHYGKYLLFRIRAWVKGIIADIPVNSPGHRLYDRHDLRYAFLSTYRTTVLIKRTAEYQFELSMIINERATGPSVRQCFVALCDWATQNAKYISSPDPLAAR